MSIFLKFSPKQIEVEIEDFKYEYTLAPLHLRAVAAIVDIVLQGLLVFIISFSFDIFTTGLEKYPQIFNFVSAFRYILYFIVIFMYHFIQEVLFLRTAGKFFFKLKVVDLNSPGENAIFTILMRNVLRPVDFLPVLYILGGIVCIFDENLRRIGDKIANTIVVKEE